MFVYLIVNMMKSREFKDVMYDGLSRLLKALANPQRLEIIEMLSQEEKSVEGIVQSTGISVANASQHLQILKSVNIVRSRKQGHYVYYSLANNEFLAMYHHIVKYAINEIAELERTLSRQREDCKALQAVSLEELEELVKNENVLLMDVRPVSEFQSGHIGGAVSIPLDELISRLKDLPGNKEIIAYCRGPFCVLADEAVKTLSEKGYKVRRLDFGYPEWKTRLMESKAV